MWHVTVLKDWMDLNPNYLALKCNNKLYLLHFLTYKFQIKIEMLRINPFTPMFLSKLSLYKHVFYVSHIFYVTFLKIISFRKCCTDSANCTQLGVLYVIISGWLHCNADVVWMNALSLQSRINNKKPTVLSIT
jgi:hypothetical protein